jgi:PAS domain S-box-containing protein
MGKERYYQSIFEAASDGLIVHDVETGRVVVANPAASAMHGYAREEFIGLHAATLIHPDSQPLFSKYVEAVQCGDVLQPLLVHVRRDGSPFYVEWRGAAFTDQGRPCLLSSPKRWPLPWSFSRL